MPFAGLACPPCPQLVHWHVFGGDLAFVLAMLWWACAKVLAAGLFAVVMALACVEPRAMLLTRAVGAKVLNPVACLAYSSYLLEFVFISSAALHLGDYLPEVSGLLMIPFTIVTWLCVGAIALPVYLFVERPSAMWLSNKFL